MENNDSFFMMPVAATLNILGMAAIGFDAWLAGWMAITVGFGIFLMCFVGGWIGNEIDLPIASVTTREND